MVPAGQQCKSSKQHTASAKGQHIPEVELGQQHVTTEGQVHNQAQ